MSIKNEEEQTAIHKAALFGKSSIIELLVNGRGHMENKDLIFDEDENSGQTQNRKFIFVQSTKIGKRYLTYFLFQIIFCG